MTRFTMNAFALLSSAAPSLTCSSFTFHLRESVAWVPPLADGDRQNNAFTINAFALPSFTAPNTPSATSGAKSFTCVLT